MLLMSKKGLALKLASQCLKCRQTDSYLAFSEVAGPHPSFCCFCQEYVAIMIFKNFFFVFFPAIILPLTLKIYL